MGDDDLTDEAVAVLPIGAGEPRPLRDDLVSAGIVGTQLIAAVALLLRAVG